MQKGAIIVATNRMKKQIIKSFSGLFLLLLASPASACPFCNPQIREGIYNSQFYPNLLTMLSAFIALAMVVIVLVYAQGRQHKIQALKAPGDDVLSPVPLTTAALILGIGFGGFIDGIVLHQILQWHEVLSAKISPNNYIGKSVNMFWDGIFHLFTLLVTFTGVIMLWKCLSRQEVNRSPFLFSGGLITGWGLFNLIEGIIDHQLLKLHNVRELTNNPEQYKITFLLVSLVMIVTGYSLARKGISRVSHNAV